MNDVCRTCLGTSKLSSLKNNEHLLTKIEVISSIHISLDTPNYPTVICEDCISKVNEFYCFRKVIINSDTELREKCQTNKTNEKRISTKRTRSCDKIPRKKIAKKGKKSISVLKTDFEHIKIEPKEEDSFLYEFVTHEEGTPEQEKPLKEEFTEVEAKFLLECQDCSLVCENETEFNKHLKTVHKSRKKIKSLDCSECNLTFTTYSEYTNHKRNVHTEPGICNICGVVIRADNLKKHVQRHSEGPVTCKICKKVLKNSESLRGHILIHKGTLYECEQCQRTFRLKSEYNRHLKKHADPNCRKKMCTICGKHVMDLQRHLLAHSGERPYVCPHCNKGLKTTYALKLHIRQHTNEKPFICEYCSKGFAQKISLLAHLKSKVHS